MLAARETVFIAQPDGVERVIIAGTVVADDDPVVAGNEHSFEATHPTAEASPVQILHPAPDVSEFAPSDPRFGGETTDSDPDPEEDQGDDDTGDGQPTGDPAAAKPGTRKSRG